MVTVDGCVHAKGIKTSANSSSIPEPTQDLNPSSQTREPDTAIASNSSNHTTSSFSNTSQRQERPRGATMSSVHTSVCSSRSASSGDDDGICSTSGNDVDGPQLVSSTSGAFLQTLGNNFKILPRTDPVRELQTIIRDKNTSRSDFVFYADRLVS